MKIPFYKKILSHAMYPSFFLKRHQVINSLVYPHCRLQGKNGIFLKNSVICRNTCLKCFDTPGGLGSIHIIDSYVSDGCYFSSGGSIVIEESTLAPNVFVGSYHHNMDHLGIWDADLRQFHIVINKGCFIGQNATIIGDVVVGEHSVIGACSVVTKNIPAYSMVVGNPARVIKKYDLSTKKWQKNDALV